jgi:hypothetical protein
MMAILRILGFSQKLLRLQIKRCPISRFVEGKRFGFVAAVGKLANATDYDDTTISGNRAGAIRSNAVSSMN